MGEFLSHPGVPLKEHLKEVGRRCEEIIELTPLNWDKEWLKKIAYTIGLGHDFGKYTTFFQKHLRGEGKSNEKSRHAFLSSIFTAYSLLSLFPSEGQNFPPYFYAPLLAFLSVFHHHTDLSYPENEIPLSTYLDDPPRFINAPNEPRPHRTRLINTYQQIEDIKSYGLAEAEVFYGEEAGLSSLRDFLNKGWLDTLRRLRKLWKKFQQEGEELRLELFWLFVILYSTLLDSDKKSAGRITTPRRRFIPYDLVEVYKNKVLYLRTPHPLDSLREKIYKCVLQKIENISLNEHLFSLTAPTGSGKTLTALACALKLRRRIEQEKGYSPRIIYALPFINIIEQNYSIFREVLSLGIEDFLKNEHSYLIAHHHLAEVIYREEEEEKTPEEAYHLFEAWDSEIIVTTFVQLFYSIIGYKNSFLRKLHNIAGSIILLDEVQNVPVEYWQVIGKTLSSLVNYLNCYVVLLTATQPFFLPQDKRIELVETPKEKFKGLNRVVMHFSENINSKEDFINWLKKSYKPDYSYLVVVNTIPSSIDIYQRVRDVLKPAHLFYLSTNIIPKQRRERIQKIKKLLSKDEKPFLVSTQVVEAGVDLDFDIAIRDIGPLDSLVQIAGRCNREGQKPLGLFYVLHFENESCKVYRHIHISSTLELLKEKGREGRGIKEEEFIELVEEFFKTIHYKVGTNESKEIWEAILDLRFYCDEMSSISQFQLIKEDIPEVEIFVEMDRKATKVWEQFLSLKEEKELSKRRELFLKIRKDFYDYVVAVPKERAEKNPPPSCGSFLFIPISQLDDFYSEETGFKWEGETAIW